MLARIVFLVLFLLTPTHVFSEPGGNSGPGGGSQGPSGSQGQKPGGEQGPPPEMAQEMEECEKGMKEYFGNFGQDFTKSIHWAIMQYREKVRFTKMIPAMAGASMCRMNKELKRAKWDGSLPFSYEAKFPKGNSGQTMTIKMEVEVPSASTWGEGWSDFSRGAKVTVNGTLVMQVAWEGDPNPESDSTKGMFVMNNMRQAFEGVSNETHSVILKWNRKGDTTDDTDLGSSYSLDILEKFSVKPNSGSGSFSAGRGGSGFRSRVLSIEYRKNATGAFTLKSQCLEVSPDGGDTSELMSFTLVATSDDGKTGTLAVTGSRTGGSSSGEDRGLGSHVEVYKVNYETETIVETLNRTDYANRPRFQQRHSPGDLKTVVQGNANSGAGKHFGGSDGQAKFEKFNPQEAFKKE